MMRTTLISHQVRSFLLWLCMMAPFVTAAQWEDVSVQHLLPVSTESSWFGCGLSVADFDGDGWDDVTASSTDGRVSLFKGGPDGLALHQEMVHDSESKAVLWVDIDNDGDLDLFAGVMNVGVHLYLQQEDGTLIEDGVAHGVPILPDWQVRGFSACDYDKDNDLDIYIASYHAAESNLAYENMLLQNQGDGTFIDVTEEAGVGNGLKHSFQGAWFDFDDDGLDDLWVINDRSVYTNSLYKNMGDGSFFDIAEDVGAAVAIEAMSATLLDDDNDGDWDMYMSNIENNPNVFLRNNDGVYLDVASFAGVASLQYSWGVCALDVNGDMNLDLMVATYRFPNANPYDNHLYMNLGNGSGFSDETSAWPNEQLQLYCLGRFDLDGDRSPDIIGHGNADHAQVLMNTNPDGAARLTVNLVGTVSNSHAVGAEILVYAEGVQQMRLVSAGCDYMTQHSYTQFFGMGDAAVVDSICIAWPSGLEEVLYDIPADTAMTVIEGTVNVELEPLDAICPWNSMTFLLPFDTAHVEFTWNSVPVEENFVQVDTAGTYVLEGSWWNGQYSWSQIVEVELLLPPLAAWELTQPDCVGDSGSFGWNSAEALHLIWEEDSLSNSGTGLAVPPGEHTMIWDYGQGCTQELQMDVTLPVPILIEVDVLHPPCFGEPGQATVDVDGGVPPLGVSWGNASLDTLWPGPLLFSAIDSLGCMETLEIIIVEPELIDASASFEYDGLSDSAQVLLNVEGGTAPHDIMWTGPIDSEGWAFAPADLAWLVEDANGCFHLGTLSIPSNSLLISEGIKEEPWLCNRQGQALVWKGDWSAIDRITAFDLSGRQLLNVDQGTWNGEGLDLGTVAPVLVRVVLAHGRVVVLSL